MSCACSAYTNKLITAKDHAAVQINIGHLNENGQYVDGNFTTFALAGNVRAMVCISLFIADVCYHATFAMWR